jgi:hypothetical protein
MGTVVPAVRTGRSQPAFVPKKIGEIIANLGSRIEPDWIVPGYLGPGLVTILGAKPKVGKSTLAASLMVAVKEGGEWIGLPVRKCTALWLDLEMGEAQTARAFQRAGLEDGDATWVWSGHRDGFDDSELRAFIEENKIDLLVIDSWSKYATVDDENNNAKLTKELSALVRIARDLGAAILLIHHQKKATANNIDDLRGGGAIGADMDIILMLYPVQEGVPSNPRRKLLGQGRFMDVTPPEKRITYREGRYVADTSEKGSGLPKRQQEALNALAGVAGPLSFSEWKLAADQPASTFKVALNALAKVDYVRKTPDGSYGITEAGRAAVRTLTGS